MFAVFRPTRKRRSLLLGLVAMVGLAACDPIALSDLGGGQDIDPNAPVPVALLVPRGSGNSGDAVLAQSLENAARLAASQLNGARVDLRVYDTAADPATAAAQARAAVADGAKIILGPVYAEAANAVGVAVAADDVNVLAFSNNPGIAGGNVFILGPTFQNTANRLVSFAQSRGRGNMIVVHGDDVAGQLGRDAITAAARNVGANVTATISYPLSQDGVFAAVPKIRAAVASGGSNAIFMTSTASGALPIYATQLEAAGVTREVVQLMGLTRWDIPPETMSYPGLQGGWFALPDPGLTDAFNAQYEATYGTTSHPIGGLAFDGIAAIGALVAQGNTDALSGASLTQINGFQGVSGAFRLLPDGTNERALAIAVIEDAQRVIIDAAPLGFAGF